MLLSYAVMGMKNIRVKPPRWSDIYCLGILAVDNEHRGLFAAVGDLFDALLRNDWATAKHILIVIPKDAAKHFRQEERLMRRVGYSGRKWHRAQHATAEKRLGVVVQEALTGGLSQCGGVIAYVRSWLPTHIMLHDRMMTATVRNFRRTLPLRTGALGRSLRRLPPCG
jgi:hemerythrin